jgi:hypothetical protein
MPGHKIIIHEDWKRSPWVAFITQHLLGNGFTRPPSIDNFRGSVRPTINHGRWVVDCPDVSCSGAIVQSGDVELFMCVDCGNAENGGNWYTVRFPADRERIETLLLRRKTLHPLRAENRNWVASETMEDLERENRDHGLDDS